MSTYAVGESASFTRKFTDADVRAFAEVSGDDNPLHLDEAYAKNSTFGRRVVHGWLVASMFSKILGTTFPGKGSIYLKQDVKFARPVFIDDEITAEVTLTSLHEARGMAVFSTTCKNADGKVVISGEATLMLPKGLKD